MVRGEIDSGLWRQCRQAGHEIHRIECHLSRTIPVGSLQGTDDLIGSCPFKRLLRPKGAEPRKIVTDKLRCYGGAHREQMLETIHSTKQYENDHVAQSHEVTRLRELDMNKFKSVGQPQQFLSTRAAVGSLFNPGRHQVMAEYYRNPRTSALNQRGRVAHGIQVWRVQDPRR